ncbi:MAG: dihydrodipicolinate synthase family protein [Atribacterota bacterium]
MPFEGKVEVKGPYYFSSSLPGVLYFRYRDQSRRDTKVTLGKGIGVWSGYGLPGGLQRKQIEEVEGQGGDFMRLLEGVVVAHLTPFDRNGNVDHGLLQAYITFLIEKGVNGLFVCGTTAEAQLLSVKERVQILETVLKVNDEKMTIVAHCGTPTLQDTRELLRHAFSAKAHGGAIVTPFYYRYSQEELWEYYATLAREFPHFPLYLYTIPSLTGNELLPSTVVRLQATFPNIVGLKDSSGNFTALTQYLLELPPSFRLIVGYDRAFLPALVLGAAGSVTGPGGVVPEPFVKLFAAWKRRNLEEAVRFQREVTIVSSILKEGGSLPTLKVGLSWRGFGDGTMRPPFQTIPQAEQNVLRENLEKAFEEFGYSRKE